MIDQHQFCLEMELEQSYYKKYAQTKYKLDDWGILSNALFTDGNYYDLLKTSGGVSTNKKCGIYRNGRKRSFQTCS